MARYQEEIDREIASAEARLQQLYAQREDAPIRPAEPPVGSVVKFSIQHDASGPVYHYAAYQFVEGQWRLSGRISNARPTVSWDFLVDSMMKDWGVRNGHRKVEFQVANKWKTVTL